LLESRERELHLRLDPGHPDYQKPGGCGGQIDALIQNASRGTGGSLIFRGEAGIGKTTLLDYAAAERTGFRVARISGVESEVELPYAALHQRRGKPPVGRRRKCPPQPHRSASGT
jgi:hypothetical protein